MKGMKTMKKRGRKERMNRPVVVRSFISKYFKICTEIALAFLFNNDD